MAGFTENSAQQTLQFGRAPLLSDPGRTNRSDMGVVRIHPSRVIEFNGNELPDWRLAPLGGGWGDSVLQTVDDALRDFAMITAGLASMINDMKMDVVKVPDLTQKLSTAEKTQMLAKRFGAANLMKSSINTLVLDEKEDWQRIQTSFGSTPDLIKTAMTIACGAGGIPESRVMGNAPGRGLQAAGTSGGEVDIRNYYDDVSSKQRSEYKPALYTLDRCLVQSALGKYDPSIDYEWAPLYQPTPQEKAQVALTKAQATQIYVGLGLINEDALRESVLSQLTEDAIYPGLPDALDEYGAEPDEPEPPPEQPTPPPGMIPKGQFEVNPYEMLKAQAAGKLPKQPDQPNADKP
jgi:phage-related protein (TIGR01555 family)